MQLREELLNLLLESDKVCFDSYDSNGVHRSTHNMDVVRVDNHDDQVVVYGKENESETLKGTIDYDEECECYSVVDEFGIITYVAAA